MNIRNKSLKPLFAAVVAAVVLGGIGALALWSGSPWLFPSLGPTIAIQANSPDLNIAKPWNVMAGHIVGLFSGVLAVYLAGAFNAPVFNATHILAGSRVIAAVLAILFSMSVQHELKADHPPAQATTLLVALGALPASGSGMVTVLTGVVFLAVAGEAVRRLFSERRVE